MASQPTWIRVQLGLPIRAGPGQLGEGALPLIRVGGLIGGWASHGKGCQWWASQSLPQMGWVRGANQGQHPGGGVMGGWITSPTPYWHEG